MRRHLLAAAAIVLGAGPAFAQAPSVEAHDAWARATAGASKTGAVYLTLVDHGAADKLTGAETPAAGMAMIHESFKEGGIDKMRMLDDVALAPDKPVQFKPGGLHIMLTDLPAPLKQGATFPLTLSFEKAAPVTVTVKVLAPGASGP
jgi:periplasmic copper chaperone A